MLARRAELLEWRRCAAGAPSVGRSKITFRIPRSTSFFFLPDFVLFNSVLFFFWFFVFDSRDGLRRKGGTARGVVTMRQEHRWHSHLKYHFFWRHLWSITEQTHGNMEFIFLITWQTELCTRFYFFLLVIYWRRERHRRRRHYKYFAISII